MFAKDTFFNDDLSDLLGSDAVAPRALPSDEASVRIRAETPAFQMVACNRCAGTGTTRWGTCFKCRGARTMKAKVFKTAPDVRARKREQAQARELRHANAKWTAFVEAHPAEAAWIESEPNFEFARDMRNKVHQYGELHPGAFAAVQRLTARAAAKAAARAELAKPAASSAYPNIRAAFDAVVARGAKRAQITIGTINVSLAASTGRNPGALYVKCNGEYAGKIVGTKFSPSREAPATIMHALDAIEADVTKAIQNDAEQRAQRLAKAEAEGREEEVPCGCCGILLTDPVSRARGIGPICAGKWGF